MNFLIFHSLMQTFDSSKQKILNSDRNLLTAGNTGGSGTGGSGRTSGPTRPSMTPRSKSNLTKRSHSTSNGYVFNLIFKTIRVSTRSVKVRKLLCQKFGESQVIFIMKFGWKPCNRTFQLLLANKFHIIKSRSLSKLFILLSNQKF